jgi:hypothetical protein
VRKVVTCGCTGGRGDELAAEANGETLIRSYLVATLVDALDAEPSTREEEGRLDL